MIKHAQQNVKKSQDKISPTQLENPESEFWFQILPGQLVLGGRN